MKTSLVSILCGVAALFMLGATACGGGSGYTTPATSGPFGSTAPSSSSVGVSIANFAFSPATLDVRVGTTVTWTNNDPTPHTVTCDRNGVGQREPFEGGHLLSYVHTAGYL